MKFYIAEAPDGRQILAGTQADAAKINKKYDDFEVAVDKAGLMAFAQDALDNLHQLRGQINSMKHDASIAPVTIREPVVTEEEPTLLEEIAAVPAGKKLPINNSWTATQIEDFILNEASVAQVENLFSCLGNRFAELAKS